MNILEAIPEIGKILDSLVSTPEEKREAEAKLKELDVRELESRFGAIKAWQSHNSLFVSGAIPSILWLVVAVTFFNYIIAPLFAGIGLTLPTLELPEAYYSLAGTIVLGLFGKKAWDSSEMRWGQFEKHAKTEPQKPEAKDEQKTKRKRAQTAAKPSIDMNDQAAVDARFAEIAAEYGISSSDTSGADATGGDEDAT